ncbi:PulJ/GspJ family protein [Gynuella sp.]|uniref:PulJ/GspJ family protein n=1 Tax=Gynuella sp. TaxID=2969146 RepID=UPI003D0993E4
MNPARCNKYQQSGRPGQRGMTLLEALVTMVIMMIIGLGIAYISGRSAVAQKDMNVLGLAIGQMRNSIQAGACAAGTEAPLSLTIGGNEVTGSCSTPQVAIEVQNSASGEKKIVKTVTVGVPSASVNDTENNALFGGVVTVDPS